MKASIGSRGFAEVRNMTKPASGRVECVGHPSLDNMGYVDVIYFTWRILYLSLYTSLGLRHPSSAVLILYILDKFLIRIEPNCHSVIPCMF